MDPSGESSGPGNTGGMSSYDAPPSDMSHHQQMGGMQPHYSSHNRGDDGGMGGDSSAVTDVDDVTGKIFIGGLSWQTTETNLRYYFEKYGEMTDVALMIDKRSGKPRLD